MNEPSKKLYAKRDIEDQCDHYMRHLAAMTTEKLHSKGDIAAELAQRDIQIERAEAERDRCHAAGEKIKAAVKPLHNEFVHEAVVRIVAERDALREENARLKAGMTKSKSYPPVGTVIAPAICVKCRQVFKSTTTGLLPKRCMMCDGELQQIREMWILCCEPFVAKMPGRAACPKCGKIHYTEKFVNG